MFTTFSRARNELKKLADKQPKDLEWWDKHRAEKDHIRIGGSPFTFYKHHTIVKTFSYFPGTLTFFLWDRDDSACKETFTIDTLYHDTKRPFRKNNSADRTACYFKNAN